MLTCLASNRDGKGTNIDTDIDIDIGINIGIDIYGKDEGDNLSCIKPGWEGSWLVGKLDR